MACYTIWPVGLHTFGHGKVVAALIAMAEPRAAAINTATAPYHLVSGQWEIAWAE